MQNLWRCRCRRLVDLKISNDEKDGHTWTCNCERCFGYRRVVDLKLPITSIISSLLFFLKRINFSQTHKVHVSLILESFTSENENEDEHENKFKGVRHHGNLFG